VRWASLHRLWGGLRFSTTGANDTRTCWPTCALLVKPGRQRQPACGCECAAARASAKPPLQRSLDASASWVCAPGRWSSDPEAVRFPGRPLPPKGCLQVQRN